jgi:hypothetical protein
MEAKDRWSSVDVWQVRHTDAHFMGSPQQSLVGLGCFLQTRADKLQQTGSPQCAALEWERCGDIRLDLQLLTSGLHDPSHVPH